jgi:FeS assembly SUF system regulator
MLKITNLADYAVVLVCQISKSRSKLCNTVQLSKYTNIPLPTVSKIMGALTRQKIVTSIRGVKGGFKLTRGADEITLADIIEALDGPIGLTNCAIEGEENCSIGEGCKVKGRWNSVNSSIRNTLAGVSVNQFVELS